MTLDYITVLRRVEHGKAVEEKRGGKGLEEDSVLHLPSELASSPIHSIRAAHIIVEFVKKKKKKIRFGGSCL